MRSRIAALIATLLFIPIGFTLTAGTAHAAGDAYTASGSGDIVVSCSTIRQMASDLTTERSYLSSHRTSSAWRARSPRASGYLGTTAAYFMGSSKTAFLQLESRFRSQANNLQYANGVSTLGTAIQALNRAC